MTFHHSSIYAVSHSPSVYLQKHSKARDRSISHTKTAVRIISRSSITLFKHFWQCEGSVKGVKAKSPKKLVG